MRSCGSCVHVHVVMWFMCSYVVHVFMFMWFMCSCGSYVHMWFMCSCSCGSCVHVVHVFMWFMCSCVHVFMRSCSCVHVHENNFFSARVFQHGEETCRSWDWGQFQICGNMRTKLKNIVLAGVASWCPGVSTSLALVFFSTWWIKLICLNSTQAASKGAKSKAKLRPGGREANVLLPTAKRNRLPQAHAPKEAASSIAKAPTTTLPAEAMHASLCCPHFFFGCDSSGQGGASEVCATRSAVWILQIFSRFVGLEAQTPTSTSKPKQSSWDKAGLTSWECFLMLHSRPAVAGRTSDGAIWKINPPPPPKARRQTVHFLFVFHLCFCHDFFIFIWGAGPSICHLRLLLVESWVPNYILLTRSNFLMPRHLVDAILGRTLVSRWCVSRLLS